MKLKKLKIVIAIIAIVIIVLSISIIRRKNDNQLQTIKSEKQLEKIYKGENVDSMNFLKFILTMPFSIIGDFSYIGTELIDNGIIYKKAESIDNAEIFYNSSSSSVSDGSSLGEKFNLENEKGSISKEYSTTNIQVENVDEADINKTDGDYIYSISDDKVVITDVRNPTEMKVTAKIESKEYSIPEDLLLYQDKLVIISTKVNTSSRYSSEKNDTIVSIYNIQNKEDPILLKTYRMYEPYYTSRCINNRLYVLSSGNLRKENGKIITYYKEDYERKDIGFNNIKYLKDVKTRNQTLISMVDLDNINEDIKLNSYLIDVENSYVSEKNIYLLEEKYEESLSENISIFSIFGWKGIFGFIDIVKEIDSFEEYDETSGTYTKIYKFNLLEDGSIKYDTNNKINGTTINQFSIDEYEDRLRLAIYDGSNGSKVVVFDNNLNKIGETSYLAKGEKMYSSRFMGNKAYLVTYQTIDPLFVIDLSDASKPKVLGELKIPGYSTYLHPYDENHIIGIGMETKETVHRDGFEKVISKTARIVGMKMALFDVSNVTNPRQISSTVIGDSKTTSAILTNHKALLFSKEKELIAIPVNNYAEDFEITTSLDNIQTLTNSYTSYSKQHVAEGYLVYNINLTDGINLKGKITHDTQTKKYSYYNTSKLLRGIWIEDNLYTISEDRIKVNKLENLEQIGELNFRENINKIINTKQSEN